jgi:hypothetical protein
MTCLSPQTRWSSSKRLGATSFARLVISADLEEDQGVFD